MYYLLNLIFVFSLTIGIALVYTNEASDGFIAAFLLTAVVVKLVASAYAQSKYFDLEDRIEKLENKKEEKE